MTEDEMVGQHHQLNGHEFEQALGVGDGQGSLDCCSPWSHKELDMTKKLNRTELNHSEQNKAGPNLYRVYNYKRKKNLIGIWCFFSHGYNHSSSPLEIIMHFGALI